MVITVTGRARGPTGRRAERTDGEWEGQRGGGREKGRDAIAKDLLLEEYVHKSDLLSRAPGDGGLVIGDLGVVITCHW